MSLRIAHEEVYRRNGYALVKPNRDLSRNGRVLRATSERYRDTALAIKEVTNPSAGRIRLTLCLVDVGSDQVMGELLDRFESTVTSNRPNPHHFQGERSPIFTFEKPYDIASAAGQAKHVDGWQFKGFLYKPIHLNSFTFPQMREYRGMGANPANVHFDDDGNFGSVKAKVKVCGALTFDEVILEMFYSLLLGKRHPRISPVFGMGEFLDLHFASPSEGTMRTGFAIHFIEGASRLRGYEFIRAVISRIKNPLLQARAIAEMYKLIGQMLSQTHKLGVSPLHPHLENFSFIFDEKSPEQTVEQSARMHDFDCITWRPDRTWPAFFGFSLFDLSEATSSSYLTELGKIPSDDELKGIARRQAAANGLSYAEHLHALQHTFGIIRLFINPAVVSAKPNQNFLRSYLEDNTIPDDHPAAQNPSQAVSRLALLFGANPYRYPSGGNHPERLILDSVRRKLENLNPFELVA